MMNWRKSGRLIAGMMLGLATPALAQPPAGAPRLLVVISVDQFSADLFNAYRPYFSDGMKRLEGGVVFPNAYQSHAATETCPGHSTILTGNRPEHTGIIANQWIDQSVKRADKTVYCAEDADAPGATAQAYVPSPHYLKVPTLGGRMKAANPAAKVIAVAGKDRAAIMMGGPAVDQIWWWGKRGFTSYRGTKPTPLIAQVNAGVAKMLDADRAPMTLPALCAAQDDPVQVTQNTFIGTGRFARKAGDDGAFKASPAFDAAVLVLADSLIEQQKMGQGATTDLIAIGLSATDYIGHQYGTGGAEMCIQMLSLDRSLGAFFERLDRTGVDYMVVLTADHGGQDAPERQRENAMPDAQRVDPGLRPGQVNAILAATTGLSGQLILADGPFGDVYVNKAFAPAERARILSAAAAYYRGNRQVAAVFTHAQLAAAPEPSGPPETWPLIARAKASFDPARSGDLIVLLKPRVTPIADASHGAVASHGSPWDYDRRVPLLFWRKGLVHFEQPQGVETVDIMPTLAAQIGLKLPAQGPDAGPDTGYDGRCLDLDAGAPDSCPSR